MELQAMRPKDWPAVRAVYQAGIDGGDAPSRPPCLAHCRSLALRIFQFAMLQ